MAIELGYSYVNLGNGTTGPDQHFDPTTPNGHVFQFHNITSQDVKLGVRWNSGARRPMRRRLSPRADDTSLS